MGFFSQHAGNQGQHPVTTVIAQGCSVNGSFRLNSDMQVDGYIEGKITSGNTIIISTSGRIKGHVTADKIIINGLFDGECYANTIEILQQGKVQGIIHSDELSIERGGSFIGETHPTSSEQIISLPKSSDEPQAPELLENKAE